MPAIENELPLSGCRLRIQDLADGSRLGQLIGPDGRKLDDAWCGPTRRVSGWFGRAHTAERAPVESGRWWALAFGSGGSAEPLEIRFAGLAARLVVPVVANESGLWAAEVTGSFRAATVVSGTAVSTVRLRYVT